MPVYRVYRAATPYNGSQLAEVDYEQTTDTVYLAHLDHDAGKAGALGSRKLALLGTDLRA